MGKCEKHDCAYKMRISYNDPTPICGYCLQTGISRNCDIEDCMCYVSMDNEERLALNKKKFSTLKRYEKGIHSGEMY